MQTSAQNNIRIESSRLRALLDKLDAEPEFRTTTNQRRGERYPYRDRSVVVELGDGDGAVRVTGVTRNISRQGIGLLVGRFVYPDTRCRVRLVSEHNSSETVAGVVSRCRYISGTVGVHDIGIEFDRAIDLELYVPAAKAVRVLILDDDATERRVLEEVFNKVHAEVTVAADAAGAVAAAGSEPFDLIVFGLLSGVEGSIQELRDRGYVRPIVGVGSLAPEQIAERFGGEAARSFTALSLTSAGLLQMIQMLQVDPIVSLNGDSPAAKSLINVFVQTIPERLSKLEQLFAAKDWPKLTEMARSTAFMADSAGFDPIVATATELGAIASRAEDVVAIRNQLARLIQQCGAARAMPAE